MHTLRRPTILKAYSTSAAQTFPKPPPKASKFVVYCNSQITEHGRRGNIREAESLFRRIPEKTVVSYTAMLSAYAGNGRLSDARQVFENMPQRTVATWNAMITAYVRSGSSGGLDEAFRLFLRMPVRNAVSYSAMVMGFAKSGRFVEAERLYSEAPVKWRDPFCSNILINGYLKKGRFEEAVKVFNGTAEKNVVSWSSMVDGFCKIGRVSEARKLFDMMEEDDKNEFTWCSMIDGYMSVENFEDGFKLFSQMRKEGRVKTGPAVLTVIFEACGKIGKCKEGFQVHCLASRMGFESDVLMSNCVVAMYSRLGFLNEAEYLFSTLREKDLLSWNALIHGYVLAGRLEKAHELFTKMGSKDLASWTSLMMGYSNHGLTDKCVELFNNMPQRDDIAWTALISGFVNNGEHEEAISWYVQMMRSEIKPNTLTLSSLLRASASLASLSLGLQIHASVHKTSMENNLSVQNSLVSMYSKCGVINNAYNIFNSIAKRDIVSINSMITGFAHNGFGEEALNLFRKSVDEGEKPNEVTFLGVLSACTHVGNIDEGWKHFKSMKALFGLEPGPDHYACMVDLLGRAGRFDEALKLINSMMSKVEPHSGVWGALLGASRIHMNLEAAELAARKFSELEPDNAAPYVVLSNIYSFVGKKGDEERTRVFKRSKGVKKSPGCSWIDVKDEVKLFLSGDKSHVNFGDVKCMLSTVIDVAKAYD
ncbi:pentatricopeptide repeat-containing protein [Striga asiatica]|uniref:Pentatricopeptide repeat-containing protein n=1 Tax=Striga asiatica TaxID=4170 RepID=A0A5A7PM35_STRAF|nr:pentatricopeptide repeat-containing protein [Striga asiatica]